MREAGPLLNAGKSYPRFYVVYPQTPFAHRGAERTLSPGFLHSRLLFSSSSPFHRSCNSAFTHRLASRIEPVLVRSRRRFQSGRSLSRPQRIFELLILGLPWPPFRTLRTTAKADDQSHSHSPVCESFPVSCVEVPSPATRVNSTRSPPLAAST